jgi:hypothetical protein
MTTTSGPITCGDTSADLARRIVGAAQDSARQPIGLSAPRRAAVPPAPGHRSVPPLCGAGGQARRGPIDSDRRE